MNLHAINRLQEAIYYLQAGQNYTALTHLDEARALIVPARPQRIPYVGLPENDPNRTPEDRAQWRAARGA